MRIKSGAVLTLLLVLLVYAAAPAPSAAGSGTSGARIADSATNVQETQKAGRDADGQEEKIPDASTTLYRVMGVVLFIWLGIGALLFKLDRRVARLEKKTTVNK